MRWTIPPWSLLWLIGLGECGPKARARGPRSPNPPKPRGAAAPSAESAAPLAPRMRNRRLEIAGVYPHANSTEVLVVGSLGRDVEAYPKPLERQFVCKFSDARDGRAPSSAPPRRVLSLIHI